MNHGEMAVLMKGIAPVLRETVIRAVQPLADRIRQLEARESPEGPPGRDGFGLDDFDVTPCPDGRSVVLSFTRGEVRDEYELKFPVPIYRGVYKEGQEYEPGDMATWGGSLWHCDEKTTEKPDAGPWRLCVKKGRDGKSA